MRTLSLALALLCASAAAPARAEPAPAETPLTFRQAVDIALAANPSLAAARLQGDVARAGIGVARQRPNPELTLEETNELPHDLATLSQAFETAGKRRRRIALAEAGVLTREAELARTVADVRSRVRRAFYSLVAEQRRLAETEGQLRLAERTRDVARARFESGDVPRLDVLQAELATAQAENDYQAAAGQLAAAQAGLNALLARRPLQAPIAVSGGLEEGAVPDIEATVRTLLASSAELTALDRGIAEQQAKVALTRAEQVPDPTVAGTVTHDALPEFDWGWHAAVTIALPIFTRHGAAVRVEERTLDQLRAAREARAAEITGEVWAAAARAAAQQKQVQRFQDRILPQAEEVERMAEDAYRSGQTGLPALLQALQATRDVRLRALQAGADYQAALADLESAMGVPLP
jgi:cobalt-zinc-cadmium efflux system outer membrane protein